MFPQSFSQSLTSLQNPRIKQIAALREGKARRKSGKFYIEGAREIARALLCGYSVEELLVCSVVVSAKTLQELQAVEHLVDQLKITGITKDIFAKLAMRSDHDGLIAVVQTPERDLKSCLRAAELILVAEGVEKPGNLGALLRTADAAGVDALVLVNSPIDAYAPNTIRSSVGAVFKVPVLHADASELLPIIADKKCKIVAADPHGQQNYFTANLGVRPLVMVLGSEAFGLQDIWRERAELLQIPMAGICDSLNVSVSGALLMFEAVRQKSFS